jgi:hypothetical protein
MFLSTYIGGMLLASDISMAFAGLVSSPQRSVGCKVVDSRGPFAGDSEPKEHFTFSFFFGCLDTNSRQYPCATRT